MKNKKKYGFDYYISKETLKDYKKKSPELKLKWLYMGNVLRQFYPEKIIRLHNIFRKTV